MPKLQSVWRYSLGSTVLVLGVAVGSASALAQFGGGSGFRQPQPQPRPPQQAKAVDPGVRGGPAGAGGPLAGLSQNLLNFFSAAQNVFEEVDGVPEGLGPRFNMDSCAGCHAYPAAGGSSPPTNPQVAVATANGAKNTVPAFITANGPVREVRFIKNPDGTPDGGVHDLFVITGRADAPGCNITQPNFAAAVAAHNAIFRIPTPTFGLGLVTNTSDLALSTALQNATQQKGALGISGHLNTSGNTGNVTRYGWKAQNPSILVFAGEAYNVEQGVTNDAFPEEREDNAGCQFNPLPESVTNLVNTTNSGSPAADFSQDIVDQAEFIELLAAPTPASSTATASSTSTTTQVASADPTSVMAAVAGTSSSSSSTASAASISLGQQVFQNIGCSACHVMNQTTGKSSFGAPATNVTYHPLSDFAVHNMGTGLADGVSQGNANGQEFRSAPLWGVGQRIFFLHDGRTNDIVAAIEDHASSGSEANTVIQNFNGLSQANQQALVNYLRSL